MAPDAEIPVAAPGHKLVGRSLDSASRLDILLWTRGDSASCSCVRSDGWPEQRSRLAHGSSPVDVAP